MRTLHLLGLGEVWLERNKEVVVVVVVVAEANAAFENLQVWADTWLWVPTTSLWYWVRHRAPAAQLSAPVLFPFTPRSLQFAMMLSRCVCFSHVSLCSFSR